MRFEDMNEEQIERARKCTTPEERMNFIREESIDLSVEQLEMISGGRPIWSGIGTHKGQIATDKSLYNHCDHDFVFTGVTKPGVIFGNIWPDKEKRCTKCGQTIWVS